MQIVVLDAYASNPGDISWDAMKELGDLVLYDRTSPEDVIGRIGDADAVLVNKVEITDAIMAACPRLAYIGVLATGYNVIDTRAAARRGITVTNIPAYSTDAVAQFTFALLLEICHQTGHHCQAVRQGRWSDSPDFCFWDGTLTELAGKTMGIIGFGNIGQQVARIARAFGMEILYYARHRRPQAENEHCRYAGLDSLLAKSDVISLHCPQTAENAGMICRQTIAAMRDGAILLNTARGGLVVEEDLAEALESGKLAAYGADAVIREPINPDNPLLKARNCYITPHIAWAPYEARARLMDISVENLRAWQQGRPQNVVNGAAEKPREAVAVTESRTANGTADTDIRVFELKNDALTVRVMNLGAHLLSVEAKDRWGKPAHVVLGLQNLADYQEDSNRIGAVVGRVANRIGKARFSLNGTEYLLAANDGENHLHGGLEGFDRKFFSSQTGPNWVRFSYDSPDGEEGYPGNLHLQVTYRLTGDTLTIAYDAVSDRDTLLNVTNHAYFNLSGGREKIYGHELRVDADLFAEADASCLPTGSFLPVEGSPFDFRSFHKIGDRIGEDNPQLLQAGGYDHAFLLNQTKEAYAEQIWLRHPASGRMLAIGTDMPTVHVYSGNWLGGSQTGRQGAAYERGDGLALETEFLPDSIHLEKEPGVILKKGQSFHSETRYRFGTFEA